VPSSPDGLPSGFQVRPQLLSVCAPTSEGTCNSVEKLSRSRKGTLPVGMAPIDGRGTYFQEIALNSVECEMQCFRGTRPAEHGNLPALETPHAKERPGVSMIRVPVLPRVGSSIYSFDCRPLSGNSSPGSPFRRTACPLILVRILHSIGLPSSESAAWGIPGLITGCSCPNAREEWR
jgi:hypothetical protein